MAKSQVSRDKSWNSAIYDGLVAHRRVSPVVHDFRYRVFSMLLDLDELTALDDALPLFAHNRAGIVSFHDRDHGDGRPLRTWLHGLLDGAGITADGPIRVLCYPRLFGYVFNPLSVWFCNDRNNVLQGMVYEVHNTYDERHAYVLPADPDVHEQVHGCDKDFYVSPFLSMDCAYRFRIQPPDENILISIQETEADVPVLTATFAGHHVALTGRSLASALLRRPLMTVKVIVAIHFEAVRLMLKRVRRHDHAPATTKP